SDPKDVDLVLRNTTSLGDETKLVAFGEGVATKHLASSGSSQRNVSGERSTDPMPLLNMDFEFIEPFQELESSCFIWLWKSLQSSKQGCLTYALSSIREEFVRDLIETEGPDDFAYLLSLCSVLEWSTEHFDVELVGLSSLLEIDLLVGFNREDDSQLINSEEEELRLVERCDISAAEARLAKTNAKLMSYRKILE
ncbi:hypothetical protein ACLOJK_034478, partial [Asimina triloba]